MLTYSATPRVYLDPTVISYSVAPPHQNPQIALWQAESRRFWNNFQSQFAFVVSDTVIGEISKGDAMQATKRNAAVAHFPCLRFSEEADALAQQLLAARAVPETEETDAEHIAIATVNGVDYLVSWNHKHLVNPNQLKQIHRVCEAAGYDPVPICTPITLMEGPIMKEKFVGRGYLPGFDPETYTDPILEECRRMKREFSAQFKTREERYAYLAAQGEKRRKAGYKYLPLPPHLTEYRPKKKD